MTTIDKSPHFRGFLNFRVPKTTPKCDRKGDCGHLEVRCPLTPALGGPETTPPQETDSLTNRIDNSEVDIEPWKAAGVSRATYFRQQAKDREGDPFIPQIMMLWCAPYSAETSSLFVLPTALRFIDRRTPTVLVVCSL